MMNRRQSPPLDPSNFGQPPKQGESPGQQQLQQPQSPTQSVASVGRSEKLKKLDSEINTFVNKFNDPLLADDEVEIVRKRLSVLYNEKGVINTNYKEFLDAVYDYTRSLEYLKTDTTFVNRSFVFTEFDLPKQALDDAVKALKLNRRNETALFIKKEILQRFPTALEDDLI